MQSDIRVVKLRSTNLVARILVMCKSDLVYTSGYIYSNGRQEYKAQVVYMFCENLLRDIIPRVIGESEEYREKVFEDLYKAVVDLNPEIDVPATPFELFNPEGLEVVWSMLNTAQEDESPSVKEKLVEISQKKIKGISTAVKKTIYGQDDVLNTIQNYFEIAFSGVGDPDRPRGSFLFVGDSGCGKTMCVKEVAKHLWGDKWRTGLYTINGSEFGEEHETAKILGSPQGYVGYEDGSPLFKHVEANPESIILIDEFEKAHPKLQDVFLQILDDGGAYNNRGKRIDFTKTIIVLTSNIGTKEAYHSNPLGFGTCKNKNAQAEIDVRAALNDFCRVEFLKRLDAIIVFNQLCEPEHEKICLKEIKAVQHRLKDKGISLVVDKNVATLLMKNREESDTARDINRIVHVKLSIPLAKVILNDSDITSIVVDGVDGEIRIRGYKDDKPESPQKKGLTTRPNKRGRANAYRGSRAGEETEAGQG